MQTTQTIHCPNCGKHAERSYHLLQQLTRTQCSHCDYLIVTCSQTGNVKEAYAPGFFAYDRRPKLAVNR